MLFFIGHERGLFFDCNGSHAMPPSAVGCLAGWMIMISLSNTPSFSLSLHFSIHTHHRKMLSLFAPLTTNNTANNFRLFLSCHSRIFIKLLRCRIQHHRFSSVTLFSTHSSHPTPSYNSSLFGIQTKIDHLPLALLKSILCRIEHCLFCSIYLAPAGLRYPPRFASAFGLTVCSLG
jgi:hypothetical protein